MYINLLCYGGPEVSFQKEANADKTTFVFCNLFFFSVFVIVFCGFSTSRPPYHIYVCFKQPIYTLYITPTVYTVSPSALYISTLQNAESHSSYIPVN